MRVVSVTVYAGLVDFAAKTVVLRDNCGKVSLYEANAVIRTHKAPAGRLTEKFF